LLIAGQEPGLDLLSLTLTSSPLTYLPTEMMLKAPQQLALDYSLEVLVKGAIAS
jgi:hypothetical protein